MTTIESAATPARILVVDDEPQICRFLDITLRAQGYDTRIAQTGGDGLREMTRQMPDLVILDIGLPDTDGHAVLRELRQWSTVPVIMLSVRSSEAEKVAALDAGANDYVTKPFGTQELMARVRTLLRAATPSHAAVGFDDGRLRIDPLRREVFLDGQPLALTRKEYGLLVLLTRHADRVITQPQILRELWGETHAADSHYVRILVAKLRQKIGDDAASPRYIATEPGVGLRWMSAGDRATVR